MAEHGLFIGWGYPRAGKEATTAKVFEEAVAYWQGLQGAGEIESFEFVQLNGHGGDLSGFALLRGEPEKLGTAQHGAGVPALDHAGQQLPRRRWRRPCRRGRRDGSLDGRLEGGDRRPHLTRDGKRWPARRGATGTRPVCGLATQWRDGVTPTISHGKSPVAMGR